MALRLLIDGNSLTYRAFYALREEMTTSAGVPTGAVFGFANMLVNLLRERKPDAVVVCFDRPEPTFRHEAEPSYKAQRDATPAELVDQMSLVQDLLAAMSIPVVQCAGFEADDLLATLAAHSTRRGDASVIVSGDRDVFQLVQDPFVSVLYTRRGVSDTVEYDEAGIVERTGVAASQYVDYAALRGDASDNLPGVSGVGEKTAAKLIGAYETVEGVLAHAHEQTPKLSENLARGADAARRNVRLMRLRTDAPVELAPEMLAWDRFDPAAVVEVLTRLEFRETGHRLAQALVGTPLEGLLGTLTGPAGQAAALADDADALPTPVRADAVTASQIAAALDALSARGEPAALGWAVGADGGLDLLCVLADADEATVLSLTGEQASDPAAAEALQRLLGPAGPGFHVHDAKGLLTALRHSSRSRGLGHAAWPQRLLETLGDLDGLRCDTSIGAYLIDPDIGQLTAAELAAKLTSAAVPSTADGDGQLAFGGAEPPGAFERAGVDALCMPRLADALHRRMGNADAVTLYETIERPLIAVLARMETVGIAADRAELTALRNRLRDEAARRQDEVRLHAGRDDLNVNSSKQLQQVLFEELGLTASRKTKTGYSTNAAALEAIRGEHPIVEALLRYREVEKLRSTYGEGLLEWIGADDRIHATFRQNVARTGRLSSEDPNLHNIPVRTDQGRLFRRAFVPAAGFDLLVADYDQIELRIIAHLSGDCGLLDAFGSGQDVHAATAASVFGVPVEDVTGAQRSAAKMVGYGLAYGMEAFGLGQRLGLPTDEAAVILHAYFEAFPRVRTFMDDIVSESRERGYTETEFGRRRPIPDLRARNYQRRSAAERQAMNAPIQGLAADIFKLALIRIDAALRQREARSRLVLQVHDEVIIELAHEEAEPVTDLVVQTMTAAAELRVPLTVNAAVGRSWAEAKA